MTILNAISTFHQNYSHTDVSKHDQDQPEKRQRYISQNRKISDLWNQICQPVSNKGRLRAKKNKIFNDYYLTFMINSKLIIHRIKSIS